MVCDPVDGERDFFLLDIIFRDRYHHSKAICLQVRQRLRRDGLSGAEDGVICEFGAT